jgi:hypothetical protein
MDSAHERYDGMFSFIQYLLGYFCRENRGARIFVIHIRNATQKSGKVRTTFDSRPLWRGIITDMQVLVELRSEGLSSIENIWSDPFTADSNISICNNRKIYKGKVVPALN